MRGLLSPSSSFLQRAALRLAGASGHLCRGHNNALVTRAQPRDTAIATTPGIAESDRDHASADVDDEGSSSAGASFVPTRTGVVPPTTARARPTDYRANPDPS